MKIISRRSFLILYDAVMASLASVFALLIRFEFVYENIDKRFLDSAIDFIPYSILITIFVFYIFRLYNSLWEFAGAIEAQNVVSASIISSVIQGILLYILNYPIPRSYYFMYGFVLI